MLKLQLRKQPHILVKLTFSAVTLGREGSNDLVIDAPTVSDFHAEITSEEHRYYINDLLSANGTFVNDKRISGRCELKAWDVIRLGSVELEVNDPNKCRPGDWALRTESSQLANQYYTLKPKSVVGRDPECDVSIDNNMLSRRHAELFIENDQLRVVDLNSGNGTFLNGKQIVEARARPGDELRFDEQAFIVVGPKGTQQKESAEDDGRTQLRDERSSETVIAITPDIDETRLASPLSVDDKPHSMASEPDIDETRLASPLSEGDKSHPMPSESDIDETRLASPLSEGDKSHPMASEPDLNETRLASPLSVGDKSPPMPSEADLNETRLASPISDEDKTFLMPSKPDSDETQLLGDYTPPVIATPRPSAHLVERSKILRQTNFALVGEQYLLGRSDINNIVLPDTSVSKQHAKLSYTNGHWVIENTKARNGVKINGALIDTARLQSGDYITLGRVEFEFKSEDEAIDDQMATAFYQPSNKDGDVTLPESSNKSSRKSVHSRKSDPPSWLYGGLILVLAFIGAIVLYLWRTGFFERL